MKDNRVFGTTSLILQTFVENLVASWETLLALVKVMQGASVLELPLY